MPIPFTSRQAKINAEAVLGRVVGAITGKKEGENIVNITTTIDLLQVFWEAEKARKNKTEAVSRNFRFLDTNRRYLLLFLSCR